MQGKKKSFCPSGNCNLSDNLKMGRQVCFLAAFGRRGELLSWLKSVGEVVAVVKGRPETRLS